MKDTKLSILGWLSIDQDGVLLIIDHFVPYIVHNLCIDTVFFSVKLFFFFEKLIGHYKKF